MNDPTSRIGDMFADVSEFHHKFYLPCYISFAHMPDDLVKFREKFLEEEAMETVAAMFKLEHADALDGCIDLAYVALGTLFLMGATRADLMTRTNSVGFLGISKMSDGVKLDHNSKQMLIDLTYDCRDMAISLGWDFETGWARVQTANMAKVRAERPADSKRGSGWDVIKPEGWQKPVMEDLV